jgi:hypothetical protein
MDVVVLSVMALAPLLDRRVRGLTVGLILRHLN